VSRDTSAESASFVVTRERYQRIMVQVGAEVRTSSCILDCAHQRIWRISGRAPDKRWWREAKADQTAQRRRHGIRDSHLAPQPRSEPYPHREVHARVTAEIQAADRLGYDTAWVEHHFSNQYGIMPDVHVLGYLAAKTSRIRLAPRWSAVPLYEPVRVVENLALSTSRRADASPAWGRAIGPTSLPASGGVRGPPRPGKRRLPLSELLHTRRTTHQGPFFHATIAGSTKCSCPAAPPAASLHGLARTARWRMRPSRLRLDALHAAPPRRRSRGSPFTGNMPEARRPGTRIRRAHVDARAGSTSRRPMPPNATPKRHRPHLSHS
jgi:hypothetical protein